MRDMFLSGLKQFSIIYLFALICIFSFYFANFADWSEIESSSKQSINKTYEQFNDSYFSGIDYYVLEEKIPFLELNASELIFDNIKNKTIALLPIGAIYSKDRTPTYYKGIKGIYHQNSQQLFLEENVLINTDNAHIKASEVFYDMAIHKILATTEVKSYLYAEKSKDTIFVDSEMAIYWPELKKLIYTDKVNGHIQRKKVYEENIYFSANKITLNELDSLISLEGDVYLKKQRVEVWGRLGEIFLDNYNKKLKYFVLYDDIKLEETLTIGKDSFIGRKAFGEKLEGLSSEGILVLTGYPRVFQGKDVIKGNRIILRQNNQIVEVDDANTNFKVQ